MKYGVRLSGVNYEVSTDGSTELLGFVTTRFVEAKSVEEAGDKAIQMILNDPHLNGVMTSNSEYKASLSVDEIWQERWWKRIGGKGYNFYPMNSIKE